MTHPCVGAAAERLDMTRPSYERVRSLVHEFRHGAARRAAAAAALLQLAVRVSVLGLVLEATLGVVRVGRAARSP